MQVEIRLYATLREYAPPQSVAGVFTSHVPAGSTLGGLLQELKIPATKVHMRMVNGVGTTEEHVLHENDRIGLFPPIGGG